MSDDEKLSFLSEQTEEVIEAPEAVEPAPEPEAPQEKVEPQEAGEKPAPAPEKVTPPVAKQQDVPLTSLLDEREKRQQAERELADLRKWREAQEQKQQAPKAPDMFEDPEAYQSYQRQQVESATWNTALNTSEMIARSQNDDAAVDEAVKAFQSVVNQNPGLAHEFRQQRHPYGWLVNWHKRQTFLSEVGEDPEAYKARIREELRAELASAPPSTTTPPRSLASAPSAGGDAAVSGSPGSAFDQLLPE